MRSAESASSLVRIHGQGMGFVLILQEIFDAVTEMLADTTEGRAWQDRVDEEDFEDRIAPALGDSEVARALVRPSFHARTELDALTQFRTWFDPRGSWDGSYVGEQYARRERRALAAKAKVRFAEWATLVAAVESYEATL